MELEGKLTVNMIATPYISQVHNHNRGAVVRIDLGLTVFVAVVFVELVDDIVEPTLNVDLPASFVVFGLAGSSDTRTCGLF